MARYKVIDTSPRFLAVDLEKQLLPGSFEHAVHYLLEHEIDLSGFSERYCNDLTGAAAYPPALLLKVIRCASARGVVSNRGIERLCQELVTFIALCSDTAPHFATLAAFVSGLSVEATCLVAQVPTTGICTCPAGKTLYRNGTNCQHNGYLAMKYTGTLRHCLPCEQRKQCLRTPERTKVRQVAFFRGKADDAGESPCDRMKRAIDSEAGALWAALCHS